MPDFSPVAVTFQAIGTLLLVLVLGQIARTFSWRYARSWAWAWAAMFVAIMAVRIYISTGQPWPWWLVYLLAQWVFLALLFAGCRDLVEHPLPLQLLGYLTPLAVAVAILIVVAAPDFGALFMVEASIVTVVAVGCYLTLGRITRHGVGWHMMRIPLALMAILYFAYVPLYAFQRRGITIPYLDSSSLADLLAAVLLGYGMVLIAAEAAQRELSDAVSAFHAMPREMHGVVVMADVDHLKRINDAEGHEAGDEAIRSVANAIRKRIRADDLLFRWGGDEFLVVMPQSPLELVTQRFATLHDDITTPRGITCTVSWGAASFPNSHAIDEAIREADRMMYAQKTAARAS
jgi:diguanylate cyclase (GGDEF)-like protein